MLPDKYHFFLVIIVLGLFGLIPSAVQAQDEIPVREYTNPDEVVTFDRSTPFVRALDVINEFSQEYRGKVIIDRTGTSGSIEISVPPMHWKDALELILNVKKLALVEREDFFEILSAPPAAKREKREVAAKPAAKDSIKATTSTKEVRINAIFFEGNRRALREVGVDWSTLSDDVPSNVEDFVSDQPDEELPTGFDPDGPFVQVNSKGAQNVSQNVFNALVNFGEVGSSGIQVEALFSAFEADNLGEILASPSVKVMDGELGRIQVGQDFSIKQRDFAGNVTDEFFSVGTILEVTPRVIEDNDTTFIHLEINAERSSAQPDPVSTIINKQQAETESLLLDGEATVVAGLYRTELTEVRRGIPILKDLPTWFFGLRYLFGFTSEDYQMRELVVLIQASIDPGIPERYAKRDNLKDKFEVLEDERNRVRDEIINKGSNTRNLLDEDPPDEPVYQPQMNQEPQKKDPDTTGISDRSDPGSEIAKKDSVDKSKSKPEKEKTEKKDIPIVDPEIQSKEITLDLDSSDKKPAAGDTVNKPEEPKKRIQKESGDQTRKKSVQEETHSALRFYVVAASFKNEKNAEEYKKQLIREGFDAGILTDRDSSYMLVTYRGFHDGEKAREALADIKQYRNEEAWLYKVN